MRVKTLPIRGKNKDELISELEENFEELETLKGLSFATYFLLNPVNSWKKIKENIRTKNPDTELCEYWGELVIHAWKKVDTESEEENSITKGIIETEIIQEIFYSAIFYTKKHSQKFFSLVNGFFRVEEKKNKTLSKNINYMIFRCLMPILWRNINVPNEDVRLGCATLLLRFYPLRAEDNFLDVDYTHKQNDALVAMLMDESLPIRVEAVNKVLYHLSMHWKYIPKNIIKECLDLIVDKLAYDSAAEVRVAVYEGLEHLLPCGPALTVTEHALKLLAPKGIHDKTEKVRLAAFKMLNQLKGHRFIKYYDVVEMEEILLRLDFENSKAVQSEIVLLIFKMFWHKQVEGNDYVKRIKRIKYMNKISRLASLHFHRLVFSLKLITVADAVSHIQSLLISVKASVRKLSGGNNSDTTNDELNELLNFTCGSTFLGGPNEKGELNQEEALNFIKDILDSAVVLWMAIRSELYTTKFAKENNDLIRLMSNILQTLDALPNTTLNDSALVIASNLPKDKIGRLFGKVLNMVEKGKIDEFYFNHYIEAYANWDMNNLIQIILLGLKKLRDQICNLSGILKPAETTITLSRMSRTLNNSMLNTSTNDSLTAASSLNQKVVESSPPPTKRSRKDRLLSNSSSNGTPTIDYKRPLEYIKRLLASPNICALLKAQHSVYLNKFCEYLSTIRHGFGELLKMNNWRDLDMDLMISSYETLSILSLITRNVPRFDTIVEDMEIDGGEELTTEISTTNDLLFLSEIDWMESILDANLPPNQVIKMFLRCAILHLESGKISKKVLEQVKKILNIIKENVDILDDEILLVETAVQKNFEAR